MRRVFTKTGFSLSLIVAAAAAPQLLGAQAVPQGDARPAGLTRADVPAFAKVDVEIGKVRDSIQAQLAMARNKKDNIQADLRAKLHTSVDEILKQNNYTEAQWEKGTLAVSSDASLRAAFDSAVAKITGQPLPTYNMSSVPTQAAAVKLPPGAVGVHIGHVIQAFGDTPKGQGLLPTAIAEAKIAAQHAEIAAKNTDNLKAMQMHAGHVINAIDPTIEKTGPGLGYGVKKATQGVIMHIQLAAKAPGASKNVITHAGHVVVSAQNTLERCDEAIALAQKIQAATSASDAAALVSQLASVTEQLYSGVDANNDGRITWDKGEGGLQQADEHMQMMIKGEGGR